MTEENNNQQQESDQQAQQELETRAKGMGWIPESEFKGDASRFTSAEDYVERADNLMPIMKATMGKYETTIGQQKTQIDNLTATVKAQQESTDKLIKMSNNVGEQAYLRAKKDIQVKQLTAIKDGDTDTYMTLEDQKDNLEKPEQIIATPERSDQPGGTSENVPEYDAWIPNNAWYTQDKDLEIFADGVKNDLHKTDPNLSYTQVLDKITERTRAAFPQKFTNTNRDNANVVDGGTERFTGGDGGSGTKTYSHLPADAKAQCDAFIADGTIKDKATYVKDYFE